MKMSHFAKLAFSLVALAFALLQPSGAATCPSGCTQDAKGNCKCPPGGTRG